MSSGNIVDLRGGSRKPEPEEREERVERREPMLQESARTRFEQRNAAQRARRRRRWMITILTIAILIGGAAYGISSVSYLPKYSVTQVTVTGTQQVSQQDLYNFIETQLAIHGHPFISPDNVLRFNAGALEKAIDTQFPRIASAHVTRTSLLATAITVTVTERQPFALWCTDDSQTDCYDMDQSGFIFMQASSQQTAPVAVSQTSASTTDSTSSPQAATVTTSSTSASSNANNSMYVFEGAIATSSSPIGQTFVGAHLPGILAFLDALGQAGFTPQGATIENDTDFDVPLAEGFYLKASFGEDPQQLVQNLQLVLSSDSLQNDLSSLEYVDLRFGDRVYYKLKGQDQTQAPTSSSQ